MDSEFKAGGEPIVEKSLNGSIIEPLNEPVVLPYNFTHNRALIIQTAALVGRLIKVKGEFLGLVGRRRLTIPYDRNSVQIKERKIRLQDRLNGE